jgi:hypothetical protein
VACEFGKDPGGNAVANTADITTAVASDSVIDDCGTTGTITVAVSRRLVSLNHNHVTGVRKDIQGYGTCLSGTTNARSGLCDGITPSSATLPFIYPIVFPVASGKTPSLTFYAMDSGTMGAMTVVLGRHRCGLTAIASGTPFTTDGTMTQKTVTFTGTTDCDGQVEVLLLILNSSSGVLYIDDIAVTGNL